MTLPEIALTEPVGSGPLLVLGHSLGTGPLIWEQVVPTLAESYSVSLLTLPGHGVAPVPTAAFTMAELADAVASRTADVLAGGAGGLAGHAGLAGPALFAGVSIGGALALTLALRHPELFAAVASVASAASLGGRDHWTARAELVRAQSTSVLVAASAKAWFAPGSIERQPELTGRILRVLQETSDEGYVRCAEALAGYGITAQLGEIRVPVLAMGGESDDVAPEDRQDEIVAGVQSGRKAMIANAGHQPPAEQPAAVAAELLSFFGAPGE